MTFLARPRLGALASSLVDALAVVAPVACAGCAASDRAVCSGCRAALAAHPHRVERPGGPVWASLEYGGVVASVIAAFKDGGRTDAVGPLASAFRSAIAAALDEFAEADPNARQVEICAVPSTARAHRARGYAPVDLLLAAAGLRSARVVRVARARVDQAGLDMTGREANARGAFRARHPLVDRRFVLVDDIVTTGATLSAARSALVAAGADVVASAVLAQTPKRILQAHGRAANGS